MTTPFGKMEPGAGAPEPAPTAGWMAPPGHPPGVGAVDAVGAYLHALLVPGERVLATIDLHEGDVTVTDRRILVQRREFGLFGLSVNARATYAIRRHVSVSIALASVTDVARQLLGVVLLVGGLVAFVAAGLVSGPEGLAGGAACLVVGVLLIATAKKAALVVDAGSDRATVQIRSSERPRADAFFRQAAAQLVS